MSHSTATTHGSTAAPNYELKSDLARMCLPAEFKDSYRSLAYVNSICLLFLVVGLVGLKAPEIYVRPISAVTEPVPVILNEPEVVQQTLEPEPEEFTPPTDQPVETPQVAIVAAVADPQTVAFPVEVKGAVAIAATPRMASPPPPGNIAPPASKPVPTRFNPTTTTDGGTYPPPSYPANAMRSGHEGTAIIEIAVDASGTITSAKVSKSSGYMSLDDAALSVVKNRWKFPAGQPRLYLWSCVFKLE